MYFFSNFFKQTHEIAPLLRGWWFPSEMSIGLCTGKKSADRIWSMEIHSRTQPFRVRLPDVVSETGLNSAVQILGLLTTPLDPKIWDHVALVCRCHP
jgi:hypothetical protein